MSILDSLPKPFFVLAPMDDVTDTVFRQVVAGCAPPDLFFTEFVNADGLQSPGRSKLLPRLRFTAGETPLIAQIWGKEPANFYKTAQDLVQMGFAGIDLNMGCPVKNVFRNGTCSGLIENRELAVEIIKATQAGANGQVPVSVKTRLGSTKIDFSWPALLLEQKLNMLTIHGRTRSQMSRGEADWAAIGHVRQLRDQLAPDTLIVGNGDVMNRAQGVKLAEEYGLDGIMIGRGIFNNPFCFAEAGAQHWEKYDVSDRIELFQRHISLFAAAYRAGDRPTHVLNKFCKVYINGFDGAKELREQLMAATSTDALQSILKKYLVQYQKPVALSSTPVI